MKPSPAPDPERPRPASLQRPWKLASGLALLCFLLLAVGAALRHRNVTLSRQLGEMTSQAAGAEAERGQWQAQVRQDSSNYQQRLTDLQAQMTRRNDDFHRQKAALENLLALTTAEALRQTNALRQQLDQQLAQTKVLVDALAATTGNTNREPLARMKVVLLHPTPEGSPKSLATAVWDPKSQGGLLLAENLPAPPPDRDYQLWILDPGILSPISAGAFRVDERGHALTRFKSSVRLETADKFAISVERKGGVLLPQGAVMLLSP